MSSCRFDHSFESFHSVFNLENEKVQVTNSKKNTTTSSVRDVCMYNVCDVTYTVSLGKRDVWNNAHTN